MKREGELLKKAEGFKAEVQKMRGGLGKEFLVLIGARRSDLVRLGVRDWKIGIMERWNDGRPTISHD